MRRAGAFWITGTALAFFVGRFSVSSQYPASAANVWVGQSETEMGRALGKPIEESNYETDMETIDGRLHIVLYHGFSVTLKHDRVQKIEEYPYSSFNPTPEDYGKPAL